MPDILLLITILIALGFDFTNGFHDTANAIATSVSTRAVSPRLAVVISAVLNLTGAVITVVFFQAKVSNTIGKIVAFKAGLVVIIAALLGAIAWNLITWYLGLPSSSTLPSLTESQPNAKRPSRTNTPTDRSTRERFTGFSPP